MSITIPDSVITIEDSVFAKCRSLKDISFSNSVTSIGKYAFDDCSSLKSITIPNSVISIGDYAFAGCSGLTSITISNPNTSFGKRPFAFCKKLKTVIAPSNVIPGMKQELNELGIKPEFITDSDANAASHSKVPVRETGDFTNNNGVLEKHTGTENNVNANGIVISSMPLITRLEYIARSVEKGKNARCADTEYFIGLRTLTKQLRAAEEKISLWEPLVNVFPEVKAKYVALKRKLETMSTQRAAKEEKRNSLGIFGRGRKEKLRQEIWDLDQKIKVSQAEYDALDSRIRDFQTADDLKAAFASCKKEVTILKPQIEKLTEAREKYLHSSTGEYCYDATVEELKDPETKAAFIKKYPALRFKPLEVGDRFFFGRCMQPLEPRLALPDTFRDDMRDRFYYTDPDKEIEWRVLSKCEDRILVISEYLVAQMQFSHRSAVYPLDSWHKSRIRQWLNGKFYENYFTEEERKRVLKTNTGWIQKLENLPKEDIWDSIFLLNMAEVEKYFKSKEDRIRTHDGDPESCYWWATRETYLTGPNHNLRNLISIDSDGERFDGPTFHKKGVRPAMMIKL